MSFIHSRCKENHANTARRPSDTTPWKERTTQRAEAQSRRRRRGLKGAIRKSHKFETIEIDLDEKQNAEVLEIVLRDQARNTLRLVRARNATKKLPRLAGGLEKGPTCSGRGGGCVLGRVDNRGRGGRPHAHHGPQVCGHGREAGRHAAVSRGGPGGGAVLGWGSRGR